jgi:thiamine biosynthesis lipoprotein ApbE
MGTSVVVAVEDAPALALASSTARAVISEIDRTCSRFRADSELSQVNSAAGRGFIQVSALLDEAIGVALDAGAATDGLVDPTIGALIERVGYTVTFGDLPLDGPAIELEIRSAPGWERVLHRRSDRMVALPDGASLDLGAVGKAWAADRAARAAAERTGGAALVSCGGDVAVAGPDRADGWRVRVAHTIDAVDSQDVLVFDGGLATSGTESRTWRRGGQTLHHILDPSTGLPSMSPWVMASVAAATCAGANAAATGAIVLGDGAPSWLAAQRLPARLVHRDGSVVTIGNWPQPFRARAN